MTSPKSSPESSVSSDEDELKDSFLAAVGIPVHRLTAKDLDEFEKEGT
jgi:hypothetical protein